MSDRRVAVTAGAYEGPADDVTYPELQLARDPLWVVTGEETVGALRKLLARDPANPAGRVEPGGDSLLLADRAGAPDA